MPIAQASLRLEEQNQLCRINQLPHELLSHIFVLCDQIEAYGIPERYIQITASTVCRYWRKVALCTTNLWTRIQIANPVSYVRAVLYLSRCGPLAPLDIEITLPKPQYHGEAGGAAELQIYAAHACRTLEFIMEQGGQMTRWRSLNITAGTFAACTATMHFLQFASTYFHSLESFSFMLIGPSPYHPEDERMFLETITNQAATTPIMFLKPPPCLRSVKTQGIPSSYLFGHIYGPQLVGLTNICIVFTGLHPSVDHIHSMLASNPHLTRLHFSTSDTEGVSEPTDTSGSPRPVVILSSLKFLGLMHITCPEWNLSVLQTFRAPALESLALGFLDNDPGGNQSMVDFISNQATTSSPCFSPALSELSLYTMLDTQPDPEPLLRACPNITTLRIKGLTALAKRPWLVPKVMDLKVSTWVASELKDVVLGRCADGLPLKKVEVRWCAPDDALPPEDREEMGRLVDLSVYVLDIYSDSEGESLSDDSQDGSQLEEDSEEDSE